MEESATLPTPPPIVPEYALISVVSYMNWASESGLAVLDVHGNIIGRVQSFDMRYSATNSGMSRELKISQLKTACGMSHIEQLQFDAFTFATLPESSAYEQATVDWKSFIQYVNYDEFDALYSEEVWHLFDDYILTAFSFIDSSQWKYRVNPEVEREQHEYDLDRFIIYLPKIFLNRSPYSDRDVLNYFKLSPAFSRMQETVIDDEEYWVLRFVEYRVVTPKLDEEQA